MVVELISNLIRSGKWLANFVRIAWVARKLETIFNSDQHSHVVSLIVGSVVLR